MNKQYQDIIPPNSDRKSIRNIPVPERKQSSRSSDKAQASAPRAAKVAVPQIQTQEIQEEIENTPVIEEDYGMQNESPVSAIPPTRHFDQPIAHHQFEETDIEPAFMQSDEKYNSPSGNRRYGVWIISAVIVLGIIFLIASTFSHATISITGNVQQVALANAAFSLESSTTSESGIVYDIITVSADSSTTASASEKIKSQSASASSNSSPTQPISIAADGGTKATGKVNVYNNFSKESQDLVINTRLETSEGLIYKINQPIVIPGQTVVGGKTVPGSVSVSVTAEQSGEKYNSGPKDFKIFGFKGTSKYDGFYARSSGDITGGATIASAKPAGENITSTPTPNLSTVSVEDRLRDDLKKQLINQITSQLPENFVYLPDGIVITYSSPVSTPSSSGNVTVGEKATATAIILDKSSLIKQIIAANLSSSAPATTSVSTLDEGYDADLSNLQATLPSSTSASALKAGTAKILISGTVNIVPVFNKEKVSQAVSTLSIIQAKEVINGMKNVEKVDIAVSPWWKKSLPRADKITIK